MGVMGQNIEALTTAMQENSGPVGGRLRLGEIIVKRVTVIKFGVDGGGGNGTGYFEVKVRVDIMKLTNVITAANKE